MMKKHQIVIFMSLLIVTGCSSEDSSSTKSNPGDESILKKQMQAIEKANEVESLLQNSADQQRKEIEEQTKSTR